MPKDQKAVNDALLQSIASAVERIISIEYGLITIHYVDCSPDLAVANIGISVLPDTRGKNALRELSRHSREIIERAASSIRIRKMPRLFWEIDRGEKRSREIDEVLEQIRAME